MPASYAHYRFAAGTLTMLPANVRAAVHKHRGIYDVGSHGPDIFFYQNPFVRTPTVELGYRLHNISGKRFFTHAARHYKLEPSERGLAYLFGMLGHFALDSCCHPFVEKWDEEKVCTHVAMESEFDRFLLETDGKIPPHRQDLSRHIKLSPKDVAIMAKIYGIPLLKVTQSCENFMRFTRLLCPTGKVSRAVVEKGIQLLPGMADYLIPSAPTPALAPLNEVLMAQYHKAEALFPVMAAQLFAFLEKGTPLGEIFLPTFNKEKEETV